MRWDVALALRLLTHATAAVLALLVAFISVVAAIVALFGTGGFTADPPTDHPNVLAASIVVVVCILLESLLHWGWRKVVHILDAAEVG